MGKITWIAGGSINETAKNDITTYTGGNYNSYGQQVTHDAEEIIWGDDPKTAPDPDPGTVSLAKFPTDANQLYTIRSYIEGNWDGSPDAYKPGNTGIEKNANGGAVDGNGNLINYPYGVVHYNNNKTNGENKGKAYLLDNRYISCLPPMYEGYKADANLSGASTSKAYINSEEVAYIVTTFAPGTRKGDIGYIERLNPNDGTVMSSVFCILADSNGSGIFNSDELKVENYEKDVFFVDSKTKTQMKVQRLKTEISYFATEALGIKLSGALYVNQETLDNNLKEYNNRYEEKQIMKNGKKVIEYWETVYGNRTDIANFNYLTKTYPSLPAILKINSGRIKKGGEVFKFEGVTDEHAVLRIRIFRNSGDSYAHTQTEINDAGSFYKEHLIDKKEAYINNYFTEKK